MSSSYCRSPIQEAIYNKHLFGFLASFSRSVLKVTHDLFLHRFIAKRDPAKKRYVPNKAWHSLPGTVLAKLQSNVFREDKLKTQGKNTIICQKSKLFALLTIVYVKTLIPVWSAHYPSLPVKQNTQKKQAVFYELALLNIPEEIQHFSKCERTKLLFNS